MSAIWHNIRNGSDGAIAGLVVFLAFVAIGVAGLAGALMAGDSCPPDCSTNVSPAMSPPMSPPLSPPVSPPATPSTSTTIVVDTTTTTVATSTSTIVDTTTIEPAPTTTLAPITCLGTHTLEPDVLLLSGDPAASFAFGVPAGAYQVQLGSRGDNHAAGEQADQTQERWRIELLDSAGQVLAVSGSISDLPDDQTQLSESVGFLTLPADATTVLVRHTGSTASVNSITAACIALNEIDSVPIPVIDCAGNPSGVPIGEHMVAGSRSNKINTAIAPGTYGVTLVSADPEHRSGYQPDQTNETWRLEFLNGAGDILASTAQTPDLGDLELTATYPVGTVTLEQTATHVRAVHTGTEINSVTAVCASITRS